MILMYDLENEMNESTCVINLILNNKREIVIVNCEYKIKHNKKENAKRQKDFRSEKEVQRKDVPTVYSGSMWW